MNQWNEKARKELPMDMEEMLALDEALNQSESVKSVLSSLTDEEPSLAWRSELNEKIASIKPRRPKLALWVPISASAIAAATLAIVLFIPRNTERPAEVLSQSDRSVEALILRSHREAEAATVLGVASPTPTRNTGSQVFDWSKLEQS
ncbi:MAG: hypothetical protein KF812_11065 [Fimbriimonadaceae bacterium]|nr:hypothetical protein [Fimbriimonadaceae bacterium]